MLDDLYSLWLKVAPGPRPPDHYALLGLPRFCDNQEQIEAAAQKQLDELDRHSLHNDIPRREACHRMMNEVARAKIALTNPQKRAAYDLTLDSTRMLAPAPSSAIPTTSDSDPPPPPITQPVAAKTQNANGLHRLLSFCRENPVLWLVPSACLAAIIGTMIVFRATRPPAPQNQIKVALGPASKPSSSPAAAPLRIATTPPAPTTHSSVVAQTQPSPTTSASPLAIEHNSPAPSTAPTPIAITAAPKMPPPEIASNLKPIPSADLQAKSEKLIEQIFGRDRDAAVTPQAKADLARKMLASAAGLGDDAAGRFVLLRECADLAVGASDLQTAMTAINAAGSEFQVDALKIKARALGVFARGATAAQDQAPLEQETKTVIDQAIGADRYDIANYVLQAAKVAAQTVNDPAWLGQLDKRQKQIADAQGEFEGKHVSAASHTKP